MAVRVAKVKTSIYVDKELWEAFRRYAGSRGVEVSGLLEELMRGKCWKGSSLVP